jgi:hypothetical protein
LAEEICRPVGVEQLVAQGISPDRRRSLVRFRYAGCVRQEMKRTSGEMVAPMLVACCGFLFALLLLLLLTTQPFSVPTEVCVALSGVTVYLAYRATKRIDLMENKALSARSVLLQVAFSHCRCDYSIVTQNLEEPEMVGNPIPKGSRAVCRARAVLVEEYPGAIEEEIRELEFRSLHIPEDLLTALHRLYRREERSNEGKSGAF